MHVAVIGAGYVGLTTSGCLAELGHEVTCVDIDCERIAFLRQGGIPIHEPGLDKLVHENSAAGRLRFSSKIADAVAAAEIVLIAVGTPRTAGGEVDLSYVKAAARMLAPAIRPKTIVAIKSTVAVGTARLIREVIAEVRGALDFHVASNPEFLREGNAVHDFMSPDRIVIGADDKEAGARLADLYRPLTERNVPVVLTGTANAELIKYAANAFLALKIGFINDVADLCERVDGDISAVSHGIGLDSRIGPAFLTPGPGYGGSCFPTDTEAFANIGRRHSAPQPLIETLIARNEARKRNLAARILAELTVAPSQATVTLLGLAFKADTDDMRESAALTIAPMLRAAGVSVRAYDPMARVEIEGVTHHDCAYEASHGADVVVILTEWDEFRKLDLPKLARAMRGATLFDCRNLLDPKTVSAHGLRYVSLGRAAVPRTSARPSVSKAGKRTERKVASPSTL
jgi:UDPglucose 6-dehydrogenase